jgi:hydrogenase-4 component F
LISAPALALVVTPAVVAGALLVPALRARATALLLFAALVNTALALLFAIVPPQVPLALAAYLRVDATSRLFLAVVNLIFLGVSLYVWHRIYSTPVLKSTATRYVALSLLFLAGCNAVLLSNHLIVDWLFLESTTLCAAPLITRPGVFASRRASFRYLLFSSVGLGLTFVGFQCLSRGMVAGGHEPTFFVDELAAMDQVALVNPWTKLGVGLAILGLGSKLGLAPMYTWLPEAYDEAPPAVATLLGSVQWNCALVMLIRVLAIYRPAHTALVSGELLMMGTASMVVSTVSIIGTRNMKRLVAYASVNHAGVIAIGLGVGKLATYGLLLYVLCNAFIKAILFLTVGKIKAHYGTKDTRQIKGLIKDLPYSGLFLMVGTFALLGFPPFGSFIGELLILSALVGSGRLVVFGTFCVLITMTFVATGRTVFPMIWGEPNEHRTWPRQTLSGAMPKLAFLGILLVLGTYIPAPINALLEQVAASLGGP